MNKTTPTLRLLTIIKYLNEHSMEEKPIVIKELLDYLHNNSFKTERCTLINDLNALEKFNMGVCHKNRKYYYQKSNLNIAEIMLLSDAICYSNYIDVNNTDILLEKLKSLTSMPNRDMLNTQVEICVKPKLMDSLCISNSEKIHKAISENKKISFGYLHYNRDKQLIPKENFQKKVSPYKLIWDNSQYYLVGVDDEKGGCLVNYRVDKLFNLKILGEKRKKPKSDNIFYNSYTKSIDTESYLGSIFYMFGNSENKLSKVKIRVNESIIGAFIDKFGPNFPVLKKEGQWLEITVKVQLSQTFYGWIFQFGDSVKILTPEIQKEYLKHLKSVLSQYDQI